MQAAVARPGQEVCLGLCCVTCMCVWGIIFGWYGPRCEKMALSCPAVACFSCTRGRCKQWHSVYAHVWPWTMGCSQTDLPRGCELTISWHPPAAAGGCGCGDSPVPTNATSPPAFCPGLEPCCAVPFFCPLWQVPAKLASLHQLLQRVETKLLFHGAGCIAAPFGPSKAGKSHLLSQLVGGLVTHMPYDLLPPQHSGHVMDRAGFTYIR
jgi:hypothetical protein